MNQRLDTQFDHIRELEGRAGIAQSHNDEIFFVTGIIAARTATTFDDALCSLTTELEVLAAGRVTESEGGDHD